MAKKLTEWDPTFLPGHLLARAYRRFARIGGARLRELDVGVAYVPVLNALARGESLSLKQLVEAAQTEQPTMTEVIGRMERAGLILRAPNPADKRSYLFSLTGQAIEMLPDVRRTLMRGNVEAVAGFTEAEVRTLRRLLGRVIQNLEAVEVD